MNTIVILLHGIARTYRSMRPLEKALLKEGFQVINLNYPGRKQTLKNIASTIYTNTIQPLCSQKDLKIHFVTHSMGALVVRTLLANYPIHNIDKIVMLAPPNQGSEIADFLRHNSLYRAVFGPAGQELTTHYAKTLPILPLSCEIGVIAGNRSLDPFCFFILPKGNDGKVSIESTKLNNMKDHIILPVGHAFLMYDQKVINQVNYFLKNGFFDHANTPRD